MDIIDKVKHIVKDYETCVQYNHHSSGGLIKICENEKLIQRRIVTTTDGKKVHVGICTVDDVCKEGWTRTGKPVSSSKPMNHFLSKHPLHHQHVNSIYNNTNQRTVRRKIMYSTDISTDISTISMPTTPDRTSSSVSTISPIFNTSPNRSYTDYYKEMEERYTSAVVQFF